MKTTAENTNVQALNLHTLTGYEVQSRDGERAGALYDLVFDDGDLAVRYVVVSVGPWFHRRRVCIAPDQVGRPDVDSKTIPTQLSLDAIESAPPVDFDPPLSREIETTLYRERRWEAAWKLPRSPYAGFLGQSIEAECPLRPDREGLEERESHLRSMREVVGYGVRATDGLAGHVSDFVVDDNAWRLLYFVVDTHLWLAERRTLILPAWIQQINWLNHEIEVVLSSERVQTASRFHSHEDVDADYALHLQNVFDRFARGREKQLS